jgi:hypothetical protein
MRPSRRLLAGIRFAALLAALLAAPACDDATSTATSPTTSPVTETFTGQFAPGGGASRSFTAASAGTTTIALTQIGPPADLTVGLGIGIPRANNAGCYLTQSMDTTAAASPQITVAVEGATYCVRVFDRGQLTSPVAFSITIVRP